MTAQRSGSEEGGAELEPDRLMDGRLALVGVYLVLIVALTAFILSRPDELELGAAKPDVVESALMLVITAGPAAEITAAEELRIAEPISSLRLTLPPSEEGSDSSPGVVDLTINGQPIEARQPVAGRWTVALPRRTRQVTLTYRLTGVTSHRAAAAEGRAMLRVRPLAIAESDSGVPVVVRVRAASVLNLVCPDLPSADQLCGRETDGGWETTGIPADSSTVLAQVDLPTQVGSQ